MVLGLFLMPAAAYGQRGMRYGPAMTPDGPVYNPATTPEWRQAGGNFEVWQQIMMNKMAIQQQQQFQKQLQAYQKQVQEYEKWKKANPDKAAALEKSQRDAQKQLQEEMYGPTPVPRKQRKPRSAAAKAKDTTTKTAPADGTTPPTTTTTTPATNTTKAKSPNAS
jgi:type II secretory pathway pseudopilin PulG